MQLLAKLRHNEWALALSVAVVIIAVGVGLGWENNKLVPVNPTTSSHYSLEPHNHLAFMVNWDGPIYLNLAQHGYTAKSLANFFPLYPLLVHIVHIIIPSLVYSGLMVSWACLAGAIYFYLKIVKRLYKTKNNLEALRAALFFVLFPTGIFLLAAYTESLFAMLALGALYFTLQKRLAPAAVLALLATATHINGLFVVVLMALLLLEAGVELVKIAATAIVGSLGFVAYMLYQALHFHDPLAFLSAQGSHSKLNFSLAHVASEAATFNGLFLLLLIAAAWYWWSRRRSFSVYTLLYVLIVFVGGHGFSGQGRYALMAFPLELMLYDYTRKKPLAYTLAIALSSVLWAFFALRYMGGYSGG